MPPGANRPGRLLANVRSDRESELLKSSSDVIMGHVARCPQVILERYVVDGWPHCRVKKQWPFRSLAIELDQIGVAAHPLEHTSKRDGWNPGGFRIHCRRHVRIGLIEKGHVTLLKSDGFIEHIELRLIGVISNE